MGVTLRRTLASIYSIQYTAHKTTHIHNVALAIATLVLQIQICERVYKLCIVMRVMYCLTGGWIDMILCDGKL